MALKKILKDQNSPIMSRQTENEHSGINGMLECLDDGYNPFEDVDEIAADRGCKVVVAKPNQVLIDVDNEDDYAIFKRRYPEISKIYGVKGIIISMEETESASGGQHKHIWLTFHCLAWSEETDEEIEVPYVMTDHERIALAFCLGSDPVRETLNMYRSLLGVKNPIRFFELLEEK